MEWDLAVGAASAAVGGWDAISVEAAGCVSADMAPLMGTPGTYGQPDPDLEKQALAGQARSLQAELEVIQKRLAALESESTTD